MCRKQLLLVKGTKAAIATRDQLIRYSRIFLSYPRRIHFQEMTHNPGFPNKGCPWVGPRNCCALKMILRISRVCLTIRGRTGDSRVLPHYLEAACRVAV